MSYIGLWDRFVDVREFWLENRKLIDDFSSFIKEKADLDRAYGKGLEKLSKLPLFEKAFGTISPIFQGLRTYYSESAENFLYHSNYLQDDIFVKLKKLIASQDTLIQEHKSLGKRLILEKEKHLKHHEKSRNKYWKACKESEAFAKSNPKLTVIEENCYKAYIVAITQLNSFNSVFQETIKKILLIFQDQNLEKLQCLRQSLQVFIAGEASNIYSMKMHLDNLPVAIDTFNPDTDQKLFVDSTYTGKTIEDEVFISYPESIERCKSVDSVNENFLRVITNCWDGVKISEEGEKCFYMEIAKAQGKKRFITILNEKRKNGEFKVPESTFGDLGLLVNTALSGFNEVEYLSLAKQCIILSQTFYMCIGDDNKTEKRYLQVLICDHPLWKKEDYWEFMMENAVDSALDSLNEYGDAIDINQDLEMRKKSVISSAIISYTHMMTSFSVDRGRISNILLKVKEKYQLTEDELPNDLLSLMD